MVQGTGFLIVVVVYIKISAVVLERVHVCEDALRCRQEK